jgi:3-dehydroquinate synthetase
VIVALPLLEDSANVFAGLGGGLVGLIAGFVAGLAIRPGGDE